eukprot:scaffold8901_cov96-Amphora_coffeaeformis.AAC.2
MVMGGDKVGVEGWGREGQRREVGAAARGEGQGNCGNCEAGSVGQWGVGRVRGRAGARRKGT